MRRPKKAPSDIRSAIAQIHSSFNNTIISLTDSGGNVLFQTSPGRLGFSGTKESTPYASSIAARAVIEAAKRLGVSELEIRVKGVGPGRDSAVRAFGASPFTIKAIRDVTPIPHGGPRPPKPRRV